MKAISVIVATAVVIVALAVWYVYSLAQWPTATVQAQAMAHGSNHVLVQLNVLGNAGAGPHPSWVQYQTRDFNAHQSATIIKVPARTWVTVNIHQYDTPTALRNPYFNLVQGTLGDVEYVNGKADHAMDPNVISHTFAIPELDVTVPLAGVATNAPTGAYQTIQFTFYSGDKAATYHWQCFVPCGWGTYGNGGPMQTFGYMDGELLVS